MIESRSSSSSSRWRSERLRGIRRRAGHYAGRRGGPPDGGHPAPAQRHDCAGWVPAGTSTSSSPSRVERSRSSRARPPGRVCLRPSRGRRQEALVLSDTHEHVEVPRRPAALAGVAAAAQPDALPAGDPGGHVHLERLVNGAPAAPWQTEQGCAGTRPSPPQTSQACSRTSGRTRCVSQPGSRLTPSQRSQVSIGVRARHRSRGSARRCRRAHRRPRSTPRAASSSEISTSTARSPPWMRPEPRPNEPPNGSPPKNASKMSANEPKPCACEANLASRAPRSRSGRRWHGARRPRGSRRASAASLNFSSASGSWLFTSGCSSRKMAWKLRLMVVLGVTGDAEHLVRIAPHSSCTSATKRTAHAPPGARGDRLPVVHAHRADHGDRAEVARREAVVGGDETERAHLGVAFSLPMRR